MKQIYSLDCLTFTNKLKECRYVHHICLFMIILGRPNSFFEVFMNIGNIFTPIVRCII